MLLKKMVLAAYVLAFLSFAPGVEAEAAPLSYDELSYEFDPEGGYGENLSIPCSKEVYVAVPMVELYPKSNYEDEYEVMELPIGEKVTVTRLYRTGDVLVEYLDYEGLHPLEYFDSEPVGEESEAACYVNESTELYLWPSEDAKPGGFAVEDQLVRELVSYPNGWSEIDCLDDADDRLFLPSDKLNLGQETIRVYERGSMVSSDTELYIMP